MIGQTIGGLIRFLIDPNAGGPEPRRQRPPRRPVERGHGSRPNRYTPHQGARERARRIRSLAR